MNITKIDIYRVILLVSMTMFLSLSYSATSKVIDPICAKEFLDKILAQDKQGTHSKVTVTELSEFKSFPGTKKLKQDQGAIFVPALTNGDYEPLWMIYNANGRLINTSQTNIVVALDPGCYSIEVGSGIKSQLENMNVIVYPNKISKIRPTWGALVVHTIDEEETPFRGLYLLFDFLSRDVYGFGRGAEEESGEKVDTWLLKPSYYKLVGPLESFDAKKNFTLFQVEENKVKHHMIVMNPDSGEFYGAGLVPGGDFTVRGSIAGRPSRIQEGGFKFKVRVGGDFSQNASDNEVGLGSNSLGFGLFSNLSANYLFKKHFFNLFLNLEGGIRKNSDESFIRKVRDEISLSSIYIHQHWPYVGEYVRLQATSQFAETLSRFDGAKSVIIDDDQPVMLDKVRVSSTLNPLFLEQSMGLNFRVLKKVYADLDMRIGLSLRETISTSGFLIDNDISSTEAVELKTLHSKFNAGTELVIISAVRIAQFASYRLDANSFFQRSQTDLRINNTLTFRVAKSVSVGLLVGFRRDTTTNNELKFSEGLFLRVSKQVY